MDIKMIDYGVGNLFSLRSSFAAVGVDIEATNDVDKIRNADKLVLPGVGAFRDAIAALRETGLDIVVCEEAAKGKPLMGVCLGMQLLFDKSFEYGEYDGLGLIPGEVRSIEEVVPAGLNIPHIGWNRLELCNESPLLKYIKDGDHVYFVHSYQAVTDDANVIARTEYGAPITAAVQCGNVCGCQFHPEKSGRVGLSILRAFCEM
ncbi:MAG: imidazole glycerol phosphate synthase subunit HisH [Mogibacterium sp.]|nr:imidazole glycerol phosphate synthase subunit HisH [Mogibacterium sp.]